MSSSLTLCLSQTQVPGPVPYSSQSCKCNPGVRVAAGACQLPWSCYRYRMITNALYATYRLLYDLRYTHSTVIRNATAPLSPDASRHP